MNHRERRLERAVQSPFFLETDSKPYQLNHVHHLQKLIYLLTTPQFLWRCFILNLPRSLAICFTLYTRNISKASPKKPARRPICQILPKVNRNPKASDLGPRWVKAGKCYPKNCLAKKKCLRCRIFFVKLAGSFTQHLGF